MVFQHAVNFYPVNSHESSDNILIKIILGLTDPV
jgi:hypothetical protein